LGSLLLSTKSKSVDSEALHQKLQYKLEELKRKRTTTKENKKKKKQKTESIKKEEVQESSEESDEDLEQSSQNEEEQHEPGDFSFGTFDFGTGKPTPTYLKKNKRISDKKLLKKIEAEKQLLATLKETQGEEVAKQVEKEKASKKAFLKLKRRKSEG